MKYNSKKNYDVRLIDTHAHLTFPDFDQDREQVIKAAWDAGLEYIITIGGGENLEGNIKACQLAASHERIYAAVGFHPHDASQVQDDWYDQLAKLAAEKKVVAIGEIGLDFFKNKSPKPVQEECFRRQIDLANRLNLPLIIHARDAHAEVLNIIQQQGRPEAGGVFHCFAGSPKFAWEVINQGFHISIPGIVTFPNADTLKEVVAEIPLEKLMLETDCPFLAPVPFRGKRNAPAMVKEVAAKIAEIKGLSVSDVARITSLAAKRLFKLPGKELISNVAYQIRNSMYLNITNQCNLRCKFCPKNADGCYEVKGHYLKLDNEPNIEEIFQAVGEPEEYDEVVFCGYGEPTKRLEVLKLIAARMKEKGAKSIRLNTDGLANLLYQRNVAQELHGLIDEISVSLNAADATTYAKICPSPFGERAYAEVINFIRECKKYIPAVSITAVGLPDLDTEKIKEIGKELGVKVRIREYYNLG
ncbi:MAG: TatD family hydrolase [Pseudomonadota bacterium]